MVSGQGQAPGGSHSPGHTHLAPPQPDHRPDMTWRQAAATGGTGSGRVTPSVGQTQSCSPSPAGPHSLSLASQCANGPEQGRGRLRPHHQQAGPDEAQASLPTPAPMQRLGRWTCGVGPQGPRGLGLSQPPWTLWQLEQVGPRGCSGLSSCTARPHRGLLGWKHGRKAGTKTRRRRRRKEGPSSPKDRGQDEPPSALSWAAVAEQSRAEWDWAGLG